MYRKSMPSGYMDQPLLKQKQSRSTLPAKGIPMEESTRRLGKSPYIVHRKSESPVIPISIC